MESPGANSSSNFVWQDRDIRFDIPTALLELRRGEVMIDSMDSVEDTKGNNGERGELTITNLRLIWVSQMNRRTNLSVGYNSIVSINIRNATSRLRGNTQALYVLTKFNGSRFEFIFTNLVRNSPRLFTTIQAVFRAYDTSKLYRDLKLRGAIISDKQLKLLPQEQTYSQIHGVWNLSSDQGSLGTFVVTNVRLVWYASLSENFNVSMPYLQIRSVRLRDSKFGPALVIETTPRSGGYILGFRIDPREKMEEVFHEILSLWRVFSTNPIFGVEFTFEERQPSSAPIVAAPNPDEEEVLEQEESSSDVFAAYYAEGVQDSDRPIIYGAGLGLAVEAPKEGVTLEQLWNVL